MKKRKLLLLVCLVLIGYFGWNYYVMMSEEWSQTNTFAQEGMEIPDFNNSTFVVLNENQPDFSEKEIEAMADFDPYDVIEDMMCYGVESSGQFVVNDHSGRYHRPDCENAKLTNDRNKLVFTGSGRELQELGFKQCQKCWP